jgi:hypothetical protein
LNRAEKTGSFWWIHGLQHIATGLRAAIPPNCAFAIVEVSLPRISKPRRGNSDLITSDKEIQRAFRKIPGLVREVFDVPANSAFEIRRVDIAWQLKGRIQNFILGHWNLRHPEINKTARIYVDESIYWLGDEMLIRIYDKVLKDTKRPGNIVRVEVELKKRKLHAEFSPKATLQNLTCSNCLKVLRRKLRQFQPRAVVQIKSRGDFLYHAIVEKWKIKDRDASDFILNSYGHKKSRTRALKSVQRHKLKACKIDWQRLVPKTMPDLFLVHSGHTYFSPPLSPQPLPRHP